jgi:hypothetical protein
MNNLIKLAVKTILLSSAILASGAWAHGEKTFAVTITNLTLGQPIAPLLVTTHQAGMSFFQLGQAPADELADLAEAGNGHPMADKLLQQSNVSSAVVGDGGTGPGGTSTVMVMAKNRDHISVGAMLGNTNDAFIALRDVDLPTGNETLSYMATGYDAGTETNDELCVTVPGPACGGQALSPADAGEGFVYVHNGIHGIGELNAAAYDWRNPAALIVIKRVQ